jgi:hypothetical protein
LADLYSRIRAASFPLIVFSCAGMAVAGGFLAWAGFLAMLWPVALALFACTLVFPFLMVPAAMFGSLMQIFTARGQPRVATMMQVLSVGWLIFAMALWGALVFDLSEPALSAGGLMRVMGLIWCVAGAAAPWAVFARGDRDNIFFTGLVLMFAGGCLAAMLLAATFWGWFLVIAGVMAALSAAQALYEGRVLNKGK